MPTNIFVITTEKKVFVTFYKTIHMMAEKTHDNIINAKVLAFDLGLTTSANLEYRYKPEFKSQDDVFNFLDQVHIK